MVKYRVLTVRGNDMGITTFVLILTISYGNGVFVHSIPGFTSEAACEVAADKWKNASGHDDAICVNQ